MVTAKRIYRAIGVLTLAALAFAANPIMGSMRPKRW